MTMSEPARLIHWVARRAVCIQRWSVRPIAQMKGALLERLPRVRIERPLALGVRRKNRAARSAAV